MQAETEFMSNIIEQRNQDINQIGDIMANINDMAKDLAIETKEQGDKLVNLDNNMGKAEKNADEALDQLKSASKHQKKAGKCTKILIALIIIILIAVGLVIYFEFFHNKKE